MYTDVEESFDRKENANCRSTLHISISGQDPWSLLRKF